MSDSLCCGTVHLTHTHQEDARCTLRCRGANPGQLVTTSRARDHPVQSGLNKLSKGDHRLLAPSIDDSSDTMSDTSDFRWRTSILTRQCVTCLNLEYPLMLLQVARSMFLKMLREPLAMATSHPREMSLSCVVPTVQRGFSTRTWTGWKRLSRAPASRDHCRKTISECEKGGHSGLVNFSFLMG